MYKSNAELCVPCNISNTALLFVFLVVPVLAMDFASNIMSKCLGMCMSFGVLMGIFGYSFVRRVFFLFFRLSILGSSSNSSCSAIFFISVVLSHMYLAAIVNRQGRQALP